jgi:uncharacterized RDD family membrane protein YckC
VLQDRAVLAVELEMKTLPSSLVLANWGRRFTAWFADYIIINVMLAYLRLEDLESTLFPQFLLPHLPGTDLSMWSPISILIFFLYWTSTEWYFGRSIGQLLLNIRLVDLEGKNASLRASAIQSLGKALLLPIDCIIGWTYRPCRERRQRYFNKLSNTIVIFIGSQERLVEKKHEYTREP